MQKRRFFEQAGIIVLFALFVDLAAYVQFSMVLQLPIQPYFFIIPTLLGTLFGGILTFSRHYYDQSREKAIFEKIAKTDQLTGVLSRYSFEMLYAMEFERYQRTHRPFSLIMFDLDDFKKVNDTYGHATGDRVLQEVCGCIQHELRSIDKFSRWGGEEFIIILPETKKSEIQIIAERIRKSVESHDFGLNRPVTISLGGIEVNNEEKWESYHFLQKLDESLYNSKEEGKNRTVICCDRKR